MTSSTHDARETVTSSRHVLATRLLHAGLALAVSIQLLTSLVLEPAEDGHAGNFFFDLHSFIGLIAFALMAGFWLLVAFRRRGTSAAKLWPWFSANGRSAVCADFMKLLSFARRMLLPPHQDDAALPSAIHGLGIVLVTAMAASGTVYYFINHGDPDAGGWVGMVMFVHTALANLVWVYLIGHAGLAVCQHFTNGYGLGNMWSFRRDPLSKGN